MSDLSFDKKTIGEIFSKKGAKFLIPDYQRPYSWDNEQCENLWEDLKNFAFPENEGFDDKDEYFLGTIVTFKNEYDDNEVIDGQQRLVTLMLLLRAYYEAFDDKSDDNAKDIFKCIWGKNKSETDKCKIISEVATDEDIAEFEKIMRDGAATDKNKSLYAQNYRYFQKKIGELKISEFGLFSTRILENCIILPIETHVQNTAFRIFTTLNDRGMPLSDSDIFKSQFYKFYKARGKDAKENFIKRWKNLEELCNKNFHPRTGTPTDDLFMRYMYYLLAKFKTRSDTFHGLRIFYEQGNYKILKSEQTFEDLMTLANFWNDIALRDERRFSARILRRLYVLSYSPHSLWTYVVSLYFMGNRVDNLLNENNFYRFLDKITALILMHAIANPGTHNIRRPFFTEFQNILHGNELRFSDSRQDRKFFREVLNNTKFSQSKAITRAMLTWWTFQNDKQELPLLDTKLEVEHIFAKRRAEFEPFENAETLELLGNKSLLEKRINIRASDYRFADKKKYYLGYTRNNKFQRGTDILELRELAKSKIDFTESDIRERNEKILSSFMNYLDAHNLLK